MALDVSHEGLQDELKKAIEARRRYVGPGFTESIKRYTGPAYAKGQGGTVDFYNHAYAWISVFLPILASGNPRVRNRTMKVGGAAAFAKAVELAQNRNFELTDIKRTIEQAAVFWAFKYAVAFTSPAPIRGMKEREDPPWRPTTKCLSLDDYVWDALTKQHAECRFQGHRIIRDKMDLLAEAKEFPQRQWDAKAIEALGEDEKARRDIREARNLDMRRGEIELWEFWVPEIQLEEGVDAAGNPYQPLEEEGFIGTIYTVTEDGGAFLRAPRPFFGPRDGPYTFSGYLPVPDEVVPLSAMSATAVLEEQFQGTLSALVGAINSYKKGVAASGKDWAEKIATFMDTGVFEVDGLEEIEKHIKEIEVGGVTQQHLVHFETMKTLLDQLSGMNENKMGDTTGATATEASIAQMSAGQRMGYMTEKFVQTFVKKVAQKESFYLAMDPRTKTALGPLAEDMFVDPMTGEPIIQPILVGGGGHGNLLEEMETEIDPIFMRHTTEMLEAERAMAWEQWLLSTAPLMPQTPWVDWKLAYARKAEMLGDPSLAKQVDVSKAMMMGMMMMQSTLMAPSMGTGAQPRLGVDFNPPPSGMPQGAPKMKSSEKPTGFSANARPQVRKGPRMAGASSNTH